MAKHFNAKLTQEELGNCAYRHTRRRFARGGPFQYVAGFRKIVFQSPGKVSMARARGSHSLMLLRIAHLNRQRLLPVLPVLVLQQNGDRRADCLPMAHAGDDVGLVGFDLHTPATAKALLPPPQLTINEYLVNTKTCGNAGKEGHQALSVRFSGSNVTKHRSVALLP